MGQTVLHHDSMTTNCSENFNDVLKLYRHRLGGHFIDSINISITIVKMQKSGQYITPQELRTF